MSVYGDNSSDNALQLISVSSNIITGDNPPFDVADFLVIYPQFGLNTAGDEMVPNAILTLYVNLAHACVKEARWNSYWLVAMGWFVAHFAILYMQGSADPDSGAAAVIEAGKAKGLNTSESVGDVSVSIDYSLIGQDLNGWATWKLTVYGQQLATVGKLVGKGNMYVW